MNTIAIIVLLVIAAVAIAASAAFVSILIEDNENYKLRAERFEELYFEELERNVPEIMKRK